MFAKLELSVRVIHDADYLTREDKDKVETALLDEVQRVVRTLRFGVSLDDGTDVAFAVDEAEGIVRVLI